MERFAKTGDFCPNSACSEYGKRQDDVQKSTARQSEAHSVITVVVVNVLSRRQTERFSMGNTPARLKFWKR